MLSLLFGNIIRRFRINCYGLSLDGAFGGDGDYFNTYVHPAGHAGKGLPCDRGVAALKNSLGLASSFLRSIIKQAAEMG